MAYLSEEALQNLKKYTYKAVDKSILSKYVLNYLWNWFVTLWPLSVAPNTITLSGLFIVFLNFLTLLYFDPSYVTEKGGAFVPNWVYFSWGIGLFLYQTFDSVDGKQARRTGMAGPLGQMFDHGCDAINTTLEAIIAAQALNLGRSWWTLSSQLAALANFYLTTWEEYHTGYLYLGVFSGPVEGILMLVVVYLITGVYGPSFWDTPVLDFLHLSSVPVISNTIPNVGLNVCFMIFGAFGLAFNIIGSYSNVRTTMREKRESGHSSSSSSLSEKPLIRLLPFLISAAIQVAWVAHPPLSGSGIGEGAFTILDSELFIPFLCAWGLQSAHRVGRIILAHLTQGPFPFWDPLWVLGLVGAVDANLPRLVGSPPIIQSTPARTTLLIYTTLLLSFFAYARFCAGVINEITEFLGIACFTVRKKDGEGRWRSVIASEGEEGKKEK
ncbi:choline ethanolaminephosphotransferase [Lentinula raphanica]|nr:choline ethanolaminephosphotransferase [Lentinula raphanica]KAJ3974194.1 choline ethanolaminephosphotransferase [Lentinula raphanica]